MKNIYNALFSANSNLPKIAVLLLVFSFAINSNVSAQLYTDADTASQVRWQLDADEPNALAPLIANSLNANGSFKIVNGELDEMHAFSMKLAIRDNKLNEDSVAFNLTHVMVLPKMGLVHIVGLLNVGGVTKRTEIDFNYTLNDDLSLTLTGSKAVSLKDFRKDPKFNAQALNNNEELLLDMNFAFKSNRINLVAINP